MIQQISDIVTEIRTTLLENGFKQAQIAISVSKLKDGTEKEVEAAWKWLEVFKRVNVANLISAYAAVPKETWAFYEQMGLNGYAEQRILKLCKEEIRVKWKNRPNILKKNLALKESKKKSKA